MLGAKFLRPLFFLVFATCLFFSCQTGKANSNEDKTSAPETSSNSGSKNLIVFFSRAGENWQVGNVDVGNTAVMAGYIKDRIDADVFEIKAKEPYPQSYGETLERATKERNENARPELAERLDSIERYDNIFLGFSTWWGDCPMIVLSFLEDKNLDFSGKTIIPFNTAGGSGFGSGLNTIKEKLKNSTFKEGLTLTGVSIRDESSKSKVNEWLEGLGFEEVVKYPEDKFNMETKSVRLNDGRDMPILGIGTFYLSDKQAEDSVYWALKAGFRLIDTAQIYGNESGVGRGIRRAIEDGIVKREDVFVTTKMWTSRFASGAAESIDESLEKLGLDYIDLMLLHHSQPDSDITAYKAMEDAVKNGKLRSIGLSNYYEPDDFDRLVKAIDILPTVLQNETHPFHQSGEMKNHIAKCGTVMESWFPLGGRGNTQEMFDNEVISGIAENHAKSSAQVVLRWHLQSGNTAIPGSSNENHIKENFDIFDFELSQNEMQAMRELNENRRNADF